MPPIKRAVSSSFFMPYYRLPTFRNSPGSSPVLFRNSSAKRAGGGVANGLSDLADG